jgi:hypothetical protein
MEYECKSLNSFSYINAILNCLVVFLIYMKNYLSLEIITTLVLKEMAVVQVGLSRGCHLATLPTKLPLQGQ